MKKKVSIVIEEELLSQTKRLAANERKPFSAIIQDALAFYVRYKGAEAEKRQKAYQVFCKQPMRLSKKQLREIITAKPLER